MARGHSEAAGVQLTCLCNGESTSGPHGAPLARTMLSPSMVDVCNANADPRPCAGTSLMVKSKDSALETRTMRSHGGRQLPASQEGADVQFTSFQCV